MSEEGNSSSSGCNIEQRKLRSVAQTQLNMCTKGVAASKDPTASTATEPDQPDMAYIHGMLSKILEETADLKEICLSLSPVDTKLSSLISRITEVEDGVSQLENKQANMNTRPAAANKEDIQLLTDRLATAEDRSQRSNLRFVGIPEGAEKSNVTAFLNEFISATLDIDPTPGGNRDGPRSQDWDTAGSGGQESWLNDCGTLAMMQRLPSHPGSSTGKETPDVERQTSYDFPGLFEGDAKEARSIFTLQESTP